MSTLLAKLKKQAKKESNAQRSISSDPIVRRAEPPKPKQEAMRKVESDKETNINSVFSRLVSDVPLSERGSISVNANAPTYLEAAHKWGLLRIRAEKVVIEQNRYGADNPSVVHFPSIVPKEPIERDATAYKRGYTLWYLCGRPSPPQNPGDVDGQLTELVKFTATETNPQGSGAPRFQTPTTRQQLNEYASAAFDMYKASEEKRKLEEARASAKERIAGKRPLASTEIAVGNRSSSGAGSSNDRIVVQRTSVPSMVPPSVPKMQPAARLDDVFAPFLKRPNDQYVFSASSIPFVDTKIMKYLATDDIFSVVKRDAESTKMVFRDVVFEPLEGVYVKGARLYSVLDNRFNLDNATNWADIFSSMNLVLVGKGTYNSVWRLKRNEDGTGAASAVELSKYFPREVVDNLVNDSCVFRMPNPGEWGSFEDVRKEMVNLCEAALFQFGPKIAAMWVGRRSHPIDAFSGREEPQYKLFMVIERGYDVHKRLHYLTQTRAARPIWVRYLKSLRRCIWRYSANRCLPLDGKLGNFIDTFPEQLTRADAEGRVNAIDMDGTYYRRVPRLTAEEGTADNPVSPDMAQGWKLVWLYNILFVSCNLRMIIDTGTYFEVWWKDIEKPIAAVMHDARLLHIAPMGNRDAEYLRAREFLVKCLWKGTFRWSQIPDDPPMGNTASELATTARDLVMHYFHDFPYKETKRRLIDPAVDVRKKRHEYRQAQRAGASSAELNARAEALEKSRVYRNQQWSSWYGNAFRSQLLPMIRLFTSRLVVPGDIGTPVPLVQVLWEYAKATNNDLYPLIEGKHPPGVIGGSAIQWPRARHQSQCDEAWLDSTEWEHEPTARVQLGFA